MGSSKGWWTGSRDVRTALIQEAGQVLDLGLARGVLDMGRSVGGDGRHQKV
ncbi:MAG: hypothetical protein QOC87_2009, partial [Actinomycetota bacterium]|nr:hypothetical protein [Actinomycetota bacterium]